MNKDMILKAMDRIEVLLARVEAELGGGIINCGDVAHTVNNARQIASAVKVLVDE